MELRILQGVPYLDRIVPFINGPYRAVSGALAALDTRTFTQRSVRGAGNTAFDAPAQEFQSPYILHPLAYLDTAAAAYALFGVEDDSGVGIINGQAIEHFPIRGFPDTKLRRKGLKFTIAVPGTLETIVGMVGQDQFQHRPPYRYNLRVMGNDIHVLRYRGGTGSYHLGGARKPDYTNPAGSPGGKIRIVTEGRDLDIHFLSRGQDGSTFLHLNRNTVYFQVNHLYTP
jgi:hypothetical protein